MISFKQKIIYRYKLATQRWRLLPDFLIIGTQKGGTTSLHRYLNQHPQVQPATRKEIHFFDTHYHQGAGWYRARFPLSLYRHFPQQLANRAIITGEGSPYYLFHPLVPQRVAQLLPQVKLIVLLRNPIERAFSHYNHQLRKGRETLSFEDALAVETDRLTGEEAKIIADETYDSFNHRHFAYQARGIYLPQLQRWEQFFPRDQILICCSETFFETPQQAYQQALHFLNLSSWSPPQFERYNTGSYKTGINPKTRQQLQATFTPHNEALFAHLGQRFNWI